MILRSSALSAPGLRSTASGMTILPRSWKSAPRRMSLRAAASRPMRVAMRSAYSATRPLWPAVYGSRASIVLARVRITCSACSCSSAKSLSMTRARTRGSSSSCEKGFGMKSVTPSDCARIFSEAVAIPVSMTTGSRRVAGSARIDSRTSWPLRSGRCRSSSTRSGDSARMRASPSSAVAGLLDAVPGGRQQAAQQPADLLIVVDDQDPGGRGLGGRRVGRWSIQSGKSIARSARGGAASRARTRAEGRRRRCAA